jgi:hypothetical protein
MSVQHHDPDYELKWPGHIFRDELGRLIQRAHDLGISPSWEAEVEYLLYQAFTTTRPADDFLQMMRLHHSTPTAGYDYSEEPF